MEHDKLIEAMARAMENAIGESLIGSEFLATAALKALRDTLEPVGYALHYPRNPEHNEIEYAYPDKPPLTDADKAAGWISTPLYALPEVKP